MRRFNILITIIVCFCIKTSAQDIWEEIVLPDSIAVVSFCFNGDETYLATDKGVYQSINNCEDWSYIGLGQFGSYNIHYSKLGNLYAADAFDLFKYEGDNNWSFLSESDFLCIYESNNGHLFIGKWGGISKSTDGGINWTEVLDTYNTEFIYDITENNSGILFAGGHSFSPDLSPGGFYKSVDSGNTWQLVGLEYKYVSSISINSNDEIYAAVRQSGVYKSIDDGTNWELIYSNVSANSITINTYDEISFCCHPETYTYGGIHFSTDNGINWNDITGNLPGIYNKRVAFNDNNILFVMNLGSHLYRTINPLVNSQEIINETETYSFPNPTKTHLTIHHSLNQQNNKVSLIEIFNISGIKIIDRKLSFDEMQSGIIKIDVSSLNNGIYVYKIQNDKYIFSNKFIKK